MKKLGLVGGMGPESTIPYYHAIVYGVKDRIGEKFFPNLTIESVNVFEALKLCNEQKYDELTDYLMRAIRNLIKSGADFVALSANTPHIISSELELGIVKEETLENFQKIIKRMTEEEGIEAIILGCTELPLLLNDEVSPVPCLDTMKIHTQHLIDWIVV